METNENIAGERSVGANTLASALSNASQSENPAPASGSSNNNTSQTESENKTIRFTSEVLKDVQKITQSLISNFNMLKQETKALSNALAGFSGETASLLEGVDKLGKNTGKTLKNTQKAAEQTKDGTEGVGNAVDGTANSVGKAGEATAQTINKVEKASAILAIITAAVKIAMAIAKLVTDFVSKDSKLEDKIQEKQQQLDGKIEAYEALKESMEKVYSSDKYQNLEQQQKNLQEQRALIEEQKSLEEEKKKTDENKISEYNNKLKEIDDNLKKIRDQQIEAIMGKSVQEALDDFAEAYVQAWEAGEDKAKSMKDMVRDLFRSAIVQQIKMGLNPQIEKMMNELTDKINAGEDISENTLDEYVNGILEKGEATMQQYGKLLNYGKESTSSSGATAASGVTGELQAAMTEGTASQLVGLWNMTSLDLREIKNHVLGQAETIRNGWDNVRIISEYTAQITQNTAEISRTLRNIDKRVGNIEMNLTGNSRIIN